MIKVGIAGGTGYVAGELMRSLADHPETEIDFVYSHSQAGQKIASVHDDLIPYLEMDFSDAVNADVDVLFLCLGHGKSREFLSKFSFSVNTVVIDLGNDFRLSADAHFQGREFVYGLPELNRSKIAQAKNIANPGCFATAIQLSLLPAAGQNLLPEEVHINAVTGATGAGRTLSDTSHFPWRMNNMSIYKAFSHQHLGEITESVKSLQTDFQGELNFIPVRGDFARGIFSTIYFKTELSEAELVGLYKEFYQNAAFTRVVDQTLHMKQVVNTNFCFLQVQKIGNKALINAAIDNLSKGAAGQAIQNMNLIFDLPENTGLKFKASYF